MPEVDTAMISGLPSNLARAAKRTEYLRIWVDLQRNLQALATAYGTFVEDVDEASGAGDGANWRSLSRWWSGCRTRDLTDVEVSAQSLAQATEESEGLLPAAELGTIQALVQLAKPIQQAVDDRQMESLQEGCAAFTRALELEMSRVKQRVTSEISQLCLLTNQNSGAATTHLVQYFLEIADRHRNIKQITDLATRLAKVEDGLAPCLNVLREAGSDIGMIHAKYATLKSSWEQMRNNPWIELDTFLDKYPMLDSDTWYPPLKELADGIDGDLAGGNAGDAVRHIKTLGTKLRTAEAGVRQHLHEAITELVSFSDKTLGSLAAG
jgi:hypothetical protein